MLLLRILFMDRNVHLPWRTYREFRLPSSLQTSAMLSYLGRLLETTSTDCSSKCDEHVGVL